MKISNVILALHAADKANAFAVRNHKTHEVENVKAEIECTSKIGGLCLSQKTVKHTKSKSKKGTDTNTYDSTDSVANKNTMANIDPMMAYVMTKDKEYLTIATMGDESINTRDGKNPMYGLLAAKNLASNPMLSYALTKDESLPNAGTILADNTLSVHNAINNQRPVNAQSVLMNKMMGNSPEQIMAMTGNALLANGELTGNKVAEYTVLAGGDPKSALGYLAAQSGEPLVAHALTGDKQAMYASLTDTPELSYTAQQLNDPNIAYAMTGDPLLAMIPQKPVSEEDAKKPALSPFMQMMAAKEGNPALAYALSGGDVGAVYSSIQANPQQAVINSAMAGENPYLVNMLTKDAALTYAALAKKYPDSPALHYIAAQSGDPALAMAVTGNSATAFASTQALKPGIAALAAHAKQPFLAYTATKDPLMMAMSTDDPKLQRLAAAMSGDAKKAYAITGDLGTYYAAQSSTPLKDAIIQQGGDPATTFLLTKDINQAITTDTGKPINIPEAMLASLLITTDSKLATMALGGGADQNMLMPVLLSATNPTVAALVLAQNSKNPKILLPYILGDANPTLAAMMMGANPLPAMLADKNPMLGLAYATGNMDKVVPQMLAEKSPDLGLALMAGEDSPIFSLALMDKNEKLGLMAMGGIKDFASMYMYDNNPELAVANMAMGGDAKKNMIPMMLYEKNPQMAVAAMSMQNGGNIAPMLLAKEDPELAMALALGTKEDKDNIFTHYLYNKKPELAMASMAAAEGKLLPYMMADKDPALATAAMVADDSAKDLIDVVMMEKNPGLAMASMLMNNSDNIVPMMMAQKDPEMAMVMAMDKENALKNMMTMMVNEKNPTLGLASMVDNTNLSKMLLHEENPDIALANMVMTGDTSNMIPMMMMKKNPDMAYVLASQENKDTLLPYMMAQKNPELAFASMAMNGNNNAGSFVPLMMGDAHAELATYAMASDEEKKNIANLMLYKQNPDLAMANMASSGDNTGAANAILLSKDLKLAMVNMAMGSDENLGSLLMMKENPTLAMAMANNNGQDMTPLLLAKDNQDMAMLMVAENAGDKKMLPTLLAKDDLVMAAAFSDSTDQNLSSELFMANKFPELAPALAVAGNADMLPVLMAEKNPELAVAIASADGDNSNMVPIMLADKNPELAMALAAANQQDNNNAYKVMMANKNPELMMMLEAGKQNNNNVVSMMLAKENPKVAMAMVAAQQEDDNIMVPMMLAKEYPDAAMAMVAAQGGNNVLPYMIASDPSKLNDPTFALLSSLNRAQAPVANPALNYVVAQTVTDPITGYYMTGNPLLSSAIASGNGKDLAAMQLTQGNPYMTYLLTKDPTLMYASSQSNPQQVNTAMQMDPAMAALATNDPIYYMLNKP